MVSKTGFIGVMVLYVLIPLLIIKHLASIAAVIKPALIKAGLIYLFFFQYNKMKHVLQMKYDQASAARLKSFKTHIPVGCFTVGGVILLVKTLFVLHGCSFFCGQEDAHLFLYLQAPCLHWTIKR